MNENKLFLSGVCPYCPAILDYAEDSRAVVCHSCGNVVPTRILRPLDFAKRENEQIENDRRIADGVTSSGAGVIYFDNFCEGYDWREFALHTNLSISTLDSIAEACKIKFSADPITYYLDFRCKAIPVLKKIEGLDVLEIEIIDNYKSDDISDLFEYVDLYSSITKVIESKRDAIITELKRDIKLARRFAIDPFLLHDLENTLAIFISKVNSIKATSNIEEIPGYTKAKALKDAKLAEDIRRKGIDAEKTYIKGMRLLDNGNIDNALHLFAAIYGYRDTEKLVKDNSTIFKFNEELAELAGKHYVVKRVSNPVFEPSNPVPTAEGSLSFYEIKNTIPSPLPTLNAVTDILYSFGSKIFYLRNNVSICCYETLNPDYSANVKVLDEAPAGDYVIRHPQPIYFSSDKTKFFIRKKLRETTTVKRGCFGFGRKKYKKKHAENRGNNYSLLLVDMDNATSKIIIPEIVDVMDYYNDKIFYTALDKYSSQPVFRVYDLATDTITEVLNSDYYIHSVSNGKIIYSLRIYSENNMDLYSMDIETQETVLIDSNVRQYYATRANRVYYIVGSRDDKRLYSADLDGKDKHEIMENPGRICTFTSGWLYYVNGEGINACLMKVSTDGTKNMLVASRFGKLVKVLNGYIYYIATNGDLKFVRSDGTHDIRIAPAIEDLSRIIIDNEKVYYLKKDDFGSVKGRSDEVVGYSLYSTDLYGKNLRKLSHDVEAMAEYNDRYIYICKSRGASYEIATPVNRKLTNTEVQPTTLVYYEAFDKQTGEFKEIVRLGAPSTHYVSYKRSWWPFSKYISKETTVNEVDIVSNIYPNVRENIAPVSMVEKEEQLAEQKRLEAIAAAKEAKKKAKIAKKKAKLNARRDKLEDKMNKKAEKDGRRLEKKANKNSAPAESDDDDSRRLDDELQRIEAEERQLEQNNAENGAEESAPMALAPADTAEEA